MPQQPRRAPGRESTRVPIHLCGTRRRTSLALLRRGHPTLRWRRSPVGLRHSHFCARAVVADRWRGQRRARGEHQSFSALAVQNRSHRQAGVPIKLRSCVAIIALISCMKARIRALRRRSGCVRTQTPKSPAVSGSVSRSNSGSRSATNGSDTKRAVAAVARAGRDATTRWTLVHAGSVVGNTVRRTAPSATHQNRMQIAIANQGNATACDVSMATPAIKGANTLPAVNDTDNCAIASPRVR